MQEKTLKALLLEDDPEDTLILMDLMAQRGWPSFRFTMVCAETLKSGIELIRRDGIDVVLLDLMLPDSQGIDTLLQTRGRAPDVPIVVLTGLKDEALGLEALSHGAQDYVVKGSADARTLKRTISFAVERHRLLASLENLIEKSADGMVVVDAHGKVRFCNAAAQALLGRKAEELAGKPFPYPLPSEPAELRIPAEDASERCAEVRVAEIEWRGQPARLVSLRDITDLRRVEQLRAEIKERRRMDKLKDELMSTVSHEMRTPLTVIKAAVDNLKEGLAGPLSPPQNQMVGLAHVNTQRLLKVVGNILELSRLESGRAVIHRRRCDLARLVREVVLGFQLTANDQRIAIQKDLPSDLPPAYADPDLFVQILNNLLDNALRYAKTRILIRATAVDEARDALPARTRARQGRGTERLAPPGTAAEDAAPSRGRASLTARGCLELAVVDDGPGVPEDRMGDIFNKFVQVNRSAGGEGYKGTGLGLSICKEIVERQDGRIWVENGAEGGAEFHLLLPLFDSARPQGGGDER